MFAVNDIVTVVGEKNALCDAQGQIVQIDEKREDGYKYIVKIGPRDEYALGFCMNEKEKLRFFREEDLAKNDDWEIENKIILLFGKDCYHSLYQLANPLDSSKKCMHEGCQEKRQVRILVNCQGAICEYDVCGTCAKRWNGIMLDSFPVD